MTAVSKDLNHWKGKVLELANELDEQQALWERNEKRLVRALIRLALACEGYDPALDPHLSQMRDVLRQGILSPSRLEQVDILSDNIVRAGGQTSIKPEWRKALLDFLLECAPGKAEREQLEQLADSRLDDPEMFKQALKETFCKSDEEGGAWGRLQQWFSLGKSRETSEDALLRKHLLQLVNEIEIPATLAEEAENLIQLLHHTGNLEEMLSRTARLLSALKNHLQQEREEIETFLTQLTHKLQALETQTRDVGRYFQPKDSGWNEKLSAQVFFLRQQTLEETDLQALKNAVTERLDVIAIQLKTFRDAEEERIKEAEKKITTMSHRLKELEQEAEDLRHRLRIANQQALFDALTGLPNRQAVDERLQQEIARWKRFGSPCSLLLWDIDHFKQINDRFGHRAGDKALRIVGQILRRGIRKLDFVGRYGGEEFLMLLPGTDREGALKLAEKLRKAVKGCGFNSRGKPVPITISCGISCIHDKDTPRSVFERADQALYQAKHSGRDRCVIHPDSGTDSG